MTENTTTETPATGETPANETVFTIPNTETKMKIVLDDIPAELRLELLSKAAEGYVRNAVNQANVRFKKSLEPWDSYEKAQAADAMQTAVKKPEGEKPTDAGLLEVAQAARKRLYENEVRRQGEGGGGRKTKDPLVTMVTQAVTRELFDKRKEADNSYKWTDAVKEVGGDGVEYLKARIAEKVAAGADQSVLEKAMQERYIRPAELMLGRRDTKATETTSDLF